MRGSFHPGDPKVASDERAPICPFSRRSRDGQPAEGRATTGAEAITAREVTSSRNVRSRSLPPPAACHSALPGPRPTRLLPSHFYIVPAGLLIPDSYQRQSSTLTLPGELPQASPFLSHASGAGIEPRASAALLKFRRQLGAARNEEQINLAGLVPCVSEQKARTVKGVAYGSPARSPAV
jgi:hypothetical protein